MLVTERRERRCFITPPTRLHYAQRLRRLRPRQRVYRA